MGMDATNPEPKHQVTDSFRGAAERHRHGPGHRGRVIETFVTCIVFRDGWELSSGCSYEFLVSVRTGVTTLDEKLRPMRIGDGVRMLRQTISEYLDAGGNGAFRTAVLQALREVRDVSST